MLQQCTAVMCCPGTAWAGFSPSKPGGFSWSFPCAFPDFSCSASPGLPPRCQLFGACHWCHSCCVRRASWTRLPEGRRWWYSHCVSGSPTLRQRVRILLLLLCNSRRSWQLQCLDPDSHPPSVRSRTACSLPRQVSRKTSLRSFGLRLLHAGLLFSMERKKGGGKKSKIIHLPDKLVKIQ